MMNIPACAYCGAREKMTREHIWPSGFLQRYRPDMSYSRKANAVFKGELTIKDVCGQCNNGPLSDLDAYACELYDSYFSRPVSPRQSVEFHYDYSRLARWLLKVSFNSARATAEDSAMLSPYASMLITEAATSPIGCGIFVETVRASAMPAQKNKAFRVIKPSGYRCAQIHLADIDIRPSLCARLIMINAFRFTIIVSRYIALNLVDQVAIRRIASGVALSPTGRTLIPPPAMSVVQAWAGIEHWPKPAH